MASWLIWNTWILALYFSRGCRFDCEVPRYRHQHSLGRSHARDDLVGISLPTCMGLGEEPCLRNPSTEIRHPSEHFFHPKRARVSHERHDHKWQSNERTLFHVQLRALHTSPWTHKARGCKRRFSLLNSSHSTKRCRALLTDAASQFHRRVTRMHL